MRATDQDGAGLSATQTLTVSLFYPLILLVGSGEKEGRGYIPALVNEILVTWVSKDDPE